MSMVAAPMSMFMVPLRWESSVAPARSTFRDWLASVPREAEGAAEADASSFSSSLSAAVPSTLRRRLSASTTFWRISGQLSSSVGSEAQPVSSRPEAASMPTARRAGVFMGTPSQRCGRAGGRAPPDDDPSTVSRHPWPVRP